MNEVWKPILEYKGYEVSNHGRIRSVNKILKTWVNKLGYIGCRLNGKNLLVHRLVALAFIPNPKNKPQVNHIDCNRTNNTACNLEWVTAYENSMHTINMGRNWKGVRVMLVGKDNPKSKPIHQYTLSGEYIKSFESIGLAVKEVNGSQGNISMVAYGQRKKHKGYKWSFLKTNKI